MQNQISNLQHCKLSRIPTSNRSNNSVERDLVIAEALTWEGTKFRHQGRSKTTGTDCAGVLIGIGRVFKLDELIGFKDFRGYARMPDNRKMKELLDMFMIRIDRGCELPGDFYHMAFMQNPQHLAMVMPNNEILHAASSFGRVVRHRLDTAWSFTIHGVYRYKGII